MTNHTATASTLPAPAIVRAEGTPPLSILLLLASAGLAFFGLVLSSQASLGASIVGVACLFGIWARITQASKHHRELMRR